MLTAVPGLRQQDCARPGVRERVESPSIQPHHHGVAVDPPQIPNRLVLRTGALSSDDDRTRRCQTGHCTHEHAVVQALDSQARRASAGNAVDVGFALARAVAVVERLVVERWDDENFLVWIHLGVQETCQSQHTGDCESRDRRKHSLNARDRQLPAAGG